MRFKNFKASLCIATRDENDGKILIRGLPAIGTSKIQLNPKNLAWQSSNGAVHSGADAYTELLDRLQTKPNHELNLPARVSGIVEGVDDELVFSRAHIVLLC